MPTFEKVSVVDATVDDLFAYHAAPLAFARLTPPWEHAEIVQPLARLENGERAIIKVGVGPLRIRWAALHENVVAPGAKDGVAGFDDVMESGPATTWRHEHRFEPHGPGQALLRDRITWTAPPGAGFVVGPKLERMFRFRHEVTKADLALKRALMLVQKNTHPLQIGVTGSTGLIGSELMALLSVLGHHPRPFVRQRIAAKGSSSAASSEAAGKGPIAWDPATGAVDVDAANGLDAVVHLAGENIADGRLDGEKLARLRTQRVDATAALWASLAALPRPPGVVVGAGAVGIYGDRGDDIVDEDSAIGSGPLSPFCSAWEAAILDKPAGATWRSVAMRVGIVLSPRGGALGKVLPLFQAGVGGPLADGKAYMPAIGVDDMAGLIARAIVDERAAGAINGTGPTPLRNSAYTAAVGRVLGRPAVIPVPRFALRLALGDDLATHILESMRVVPSRALALGHTFRHPDIPAALAHLLGGAPQAF
jgi:uncharacterized protein (TIGR01777 family)